MHTNPVPDMVRLPPNPKSIFSHEDHQYRSVQKEYCDRFLASTGLNRDLTRPFSREPDSSTCAYASPTDTQHCISQLADRLATDLYRCLDDGATYTIEDKDRSVLWRLNTSAIFGFWKGLWDKAKDRWVIVTRTEKEVVRYYRSILDNTLPRNLLQKRNTFSGVNIPYIYFTVKFKCFQGASQEVCMNLVPRKVPGDPGAKLPSHTCAKAGRSCLRNIVSFIKVPGRKTFKKIGRAFIHGLERICPGYSTRNRSTGKDLIVAESKTASSDPLGTA